MDSTANSSEEQVRLCIERVFIESGEQQKMTEKLRDLLTNSGWTDFIRKLCFDKLEQKGSKISLAELTEMVIKEAQERIPDNVKAQILGDVHSFVQRYLSRPIKE